MVDEITRKLLVHDPAEHICLINQFVLETTCTRYRDTTCDSNTLDFIPIKLHMPTGPSES